MEATELRKLGLTSTEARVYLALVELGAASPSEITRRSGVYRTLVYEALDRLLEKGLASFVSGEKNKKYFQASDPSALEAMVEEEEKNFSREIEEKKRLLGKTVPELEQLFAKTTKPAAKIFVGLRGVRIVFRDILASLKKGDEELCFIANFEGRELTGVAIPKLLHSLAKKGVHYRGIYDGRQKTIEEAAKSAMQNRGAAVRVLPPEYASPTTIHVYGGKTAILLYSKHDLICVVVENKEIADGFRKNFNALWRLAKPIG